MNEDFVDRLEDSLERLGSPSPIPRVIEASGDTEQIARLLDAASAGVERSRQRALRKHVQHAVTTAMDLLDGSALSLDQLSRLDPDLVNVMKNLVNDVLDDVAIDVRNKLRLTAATHPPVTHSHNQKENP